MSGRSTKRSKKPETAVPSVSVPLTPFAKAMSWMWVIKPEGEQWAVYAVNPAREEGAESEKIRLALCDEREMATDIVMNRALAEAATNWMGKIHRSLTEVFMGKEAQEYRDVWRRASIPLPDAGKCEDALNYSPLHPPLPSEYGCEE